MPPWVSSDFDCGPEPEAPPQDTTKGAAENFTIDTLGWGRVCAMMLMGRGADASRYGLLPKEAAK